MNIREAKEQIKHAMVAYFTKDEFGNYVIPTEKQRPVFLMGPPGVGKTAIMEQIAAELDVGLVSYSMTHHTRQSALGLPFIVKKTYGGKEYDVSEYTMSEIIASVYDMIETTGHKEGILFLDEINCVSETLAPAMLQFLQYKIFGCHRVPEGWIVVTAGNPPEYNRSVREFDVVTWDRLKRIDVEADLDAWKGYAYEKGVHASILTYLDIKKSDFYSIETTVDGKSFVTARGWSDLSDMIHLYEDNEIPVTEALVSQYLQNKRIAKSFAVYYDLFNKYRADYQVDQIIEGNAPEKIKTRAKEAKFDERLSLLGLLIDRITLEARNCICSEMTLEELLGDLRGIRQSLMIPSAEIVRSVQMHIDRRQKALESGMKASSLSPEKQRAYRGTIAALGEILQLLASARAASNTDAFKLVKAYFDRRNAAHKKEALATGVSLENVFRFCEEVFGDGQEILILVTELTINHHAARFISRYGCPAYFKHNKQLLFYERQKEIAQELELLDLEGDGTKPSK